jgi:hypothetical protein
MKLTGIAPVNSIVLSGISGPDAVRRAADGVPQSVRIFRTGRTDMTMDGAPLVADIDRADLAAFADYYTGKGHLIPVDCEHLLAKLAQLIGVDEADLISQAPILGERAAAGFCSLQLSDDGNELWAHFSKWTARARELFLADADGVYGYFSPAIRGLITGKLRITSITLTNEPSISKQDLLAASDRTGSDAGLRMAVAIHAEPTAKKGEAHMKGLDKLAQMLGIDLVALSGEHPDLGPVIAAVTELMHRQSLFLAGIRDAIHLSADAGLDQAHGLILALAQKANGDAASLTDLQSRLDSLESQEKTRYIESLAAAGKLTASMLPWARKQDMAALRDYAATAPVIVPKARIIDALGGANGASDEAMLSDTTRSIAAECGFTPAAVAKANRLKIAAVAAMAIVAMWIAPRCAVATAATANRDTQERSGRAVSLVQASNVIWQGTIVCVNSSATAQPATDAASVKAIGMAGEKSDNTGSAYSATRAITVQRGVFRFANGSSFDDSDIGSLAYVLDDSTVGSAADCTYDVVVGVIIDVDSNGVWVDMYAIGGQGAMSGTTLATTGNASIGGTLAVAGAVTLDSTADCDSVTVDAGAGVDTQAAGTLALGASTATKVEVADAGVETEVQGTLDVHEAAQLKVLHTTAVAVTSLTVTAAHYGSMLVVSTNAAVAITLPANGAAVGSWFDVIVAGTDDCAPTVAAATADTLIGPNDADLDSVTWGTGHRIGAYARFVSNGSYWQVLNLGGTTMTYND